MITNCDKFTFLGKWEFFRKYAVINIELVHERMILIIQKKTNPLDEYCIDNLRVIIILLELHGLFIYLVQFGNDLLLAEVCQDLNFVNSENFREELLSHSSTLLSICVDKSFLPKL